MHPLHLTISTFSGLSGKVHCKKLRRPLYDKKEGTENSGYQMTCGPFLGKKDLRLKMETSATGRRSYLDGLHRSKAAQVKMVTR